MDSNRFDDLARLLAARGGRRGLLKGIAGVVAVQIGAILRPVRADGSSDVAEAPPAPNARAQRGPVADGVRGDPAEVSGTLRERYARTTPHPAASRGGAALAQDANPAGSPTITLSPTSGKIKTLITATLVGFRSGEDITLLWFDGSASKTVATGRTSSGGKATITFTAPYAFRGYHLVRAQGSRGSRADTRFAIVPSFTLSPKKAPRGSSVKASLSGFASRAVIDVRFFPTDSASGTPAQLTSVTVSATGTGAVNFTVPANATLGLHRVEGKERASGRIASAKLLVQCATGADCPGQDTDCSTRTCEAGVCGQDVAPAGTSCDDNSGVVCDGAGVCVECVSHADCEASDSCVDNTCVDTTCSPGSQRPCYTGPQGTENVGVCRGGTQTCLQDGSGYGSCEGEVVPSVETCNGEDDDCDGVIDNDVAGVGDSCTTGLLGVCAEGTLQCRSNLGLICVQNVGPSAETCNGLDDDCDGQVDDGVICPELANASWYCDQSCQYICNSGYENCDGNWATGCERNILTDPQHCGMCNRPCPVIANGSSICQNGQCITACNPGYVMVNGVCQPQVCFPNSQRACYSGPAGTVGVGICKAGSQICNGNGTAWGPCMGEVHPRTETCNGADDDCDGAIDEGFGIGQTCFCPDPTQPGQQIQGVRICSEDGLSSVCSCD